MALSNYSELVSEVGDWLFGRSQVAAKVPTFIRLFEGKANRTLFVRQMEERARATIDLGTDEPEFVTLPGTFQTMRRVRLIESSGKPRLKFATGAQLDDLRSKNGNETGTPVWFSIVGDEMELFPTPNTAVTIEMVYRKNIPALTASAPTNWLLTLAPDLYLYGALLEAAPYLHEDERISTWASGAQGAIEALNQLSQKATYDAGPLVMRRKGRSY
jgi:hypothetical protein